VRVGAAVFAAGVLAVVVVVVPFLLTGRTVDGRLPVVAGSLLPLGFAIALVGLLRGARTARRDGRRAARRSSTPT